MPARRDPTPATTSKAPSSPRGGKAAAPPPAPRAARSTRSAASPVSTGDIRTLIIILGDQLSKDALPLREGDPTRDAVLMMEVAQESTHVPSHVQRTTLFLAAMRHFAADLREAGWRVHYVTLDDPANTHSFTAEVARHVALLKPERLALTQPGEHRVLAMARDWQPTLGLPVTIHPDPHFFTTHEQFERWAKGKKSLTMEFFYREQRRRLNYLMEPDGTTPLGGVWNYDHDNREPLPKNFAPIPRPPTFAPDGIVRDVQRAIAKVLPDLPGMGEDFAWPVTRVQARAALDDFIAHRLDRFGPYEDAMKVGEPFVYHSALSMALNLKLLDPRECVDAALEAHRRGKARLQSVEAFVRQLIGWREFIRGVYWLEGPGYADRNYLGATGRLPDLYWTGKTDMNCLRQCVGEVLTRGFGHHIQRLMITGNFALLAGVHPKAVADWYLGMYVDGVDWVTLPNALGMVMHADGTATKGPVVGTKPYAASGAYVQRMSDYCKGCKYDPGERVGPTACPFTTLYWDFLHTHRARLERNPRMATIIKNLDRFGPDRVAQITISARSIRERLGVLGPTAEPR